MKEYFIHNRHKAFYSLGRGDGIEHDIFIPVRYVAESLGFEVDWTGQENCAYLTQ